MSMKTKPKMLKRKLAVIWRKITAIWHIISSKRFFVAYEGKKDKMFCCYNDIKLWQLNLISAHIEALVDDTLAEESAVNQAKNIINGIN